MSKEAELRELAAVRQGTRWVEYGCISDYHAGAYECNFVSPYTKSAGNVNADVMILLQDWCSHRYIAAGLSNVVQQLGYDPALPTNRNLIALLNDHIGLDLADTYATNLFPFIKPERMSNRIPQRDLNRAAIEFALPQVKTVQPRLVICLGLQTFNALRTACGLRPAGTIASAIHDPFFVDRANIWCQAHTGQLGRNNRNRGGVDRVSGDWQRMASWLHGIRHSSMAA